MTIIKQILKLCHTKWHTRLNLPIKHLIFVTTYYKMQHRTEFLNEPETNVMFQILLIHNEFKTGVMDEL